jgi:transposase
MSNIDFTKDILEILQLNDSFHRFIPTPFKDSNSCIKKELNDKGIMTMYINLNSQIGDIACPHCGCIDHHESKGTRSVHLKHFSFGAMPVVLIVNYHRYICNHCKHYIHEDIPFQFDSRKASVPNVQNALFEFKENHSIASIARKSGIQGNTLYRIFDENIVVPFRYYRLSPVISIDEFKATSDKGKYAFHIVNPLIGKTLDIIEDRKAASLKNYFLRFPFKQRKNVKIIIMDLSGAFHSIMHSLFPNAVIIADKFHYVKLVRANMVQARIDACAHMSNKSLAKSIKKELHLFDKYEKRLDDKKEWYSHHLKKHFTCQSYIEYVFSQEEASEFYDNYRIYQDLLRIINEPCQDYKEELNRWIDNILDTKNEFYMVTAKNFRKNWFMPILRSLTYKAKFIRKGKTYYTSFNNGYIESMNNVVKLVKRNAHGYRYFENLRKRIILHLGYTYTFKFRKRKKGLAILR